MASRKEEKQARREERLQAEQAAEAEGRRKKMFAGIGAAALAAVVVVVALVGISQSGSDDETSGDVSQSALVEEELAGVPQRGTVLGGPKVKVRIVEFGDLQCPACAQFSESQIPELIDGTVKAGEATLEFRNFTIIGPDSVVAAKAALAASEQDRYWQFVELFYRNQGPENGGYVTDEFLTDIARGAGVEDLDAWNEARQDPKWEATLAKTQQDAAALGFQGTPSVLVEGPGGSEPLGSFPSLDQIQEAIARVR